MPNKMNSYRYGYPLNTNKFVGYRFLDSKTKLYGFLHPSHQCIKRLGLRMTPSKGRHGCDKVPIRVPFDHHIELPFHRQHLLTA